MLYFLCSNCAQYLQIHTKIPFLPRCREDPRNARRMFDLKYRGLFVLTRNRNKLGRNFFFQLHLSNVQESDKGYYMCQINTDPMRSNRGYLDVVVPPSIIDSKTSPDQVVKEGAAVNLTCGARGSPTPKIMWKREDNKMIHYKVRMMGVESFYGIGSLI